MQQTLSHHRVHAPVSRPLSPEPTAETKPSAPASMTTAERIKRQLKNPLVLVGITWVVMAALLAREIIAR